MLPKMAKQRFNPVTKRIQNIKQFGITTIRMIRIEKIVRLFLSSSQLFFPGIYILYFKGGEYEDLAVDFYVLLKVCLLLY
jgi:hypothetical protein